MKLTGVRAVHSGVFLVELAAILWLVITGIVGRRDRTVAVAGALVAAESAVFVANRGVCPLTPLAERLGARRGSVSDIFLPDALARTIPIWATALVGLGVALHVRNLVRAAQPSLLSVRRGGRSRRGTGVLRLEVGAVPAAAELAANRGTAVDGQPGLDGDREGR